METKRINKEAKEYFFRYTKYKQVLMKQIKLLFGNKNV